MIEQLGEYAKQYWYIIVGGIGVLLILGSIFKWKWVMQSEGSRPLGFMLWILDVFGSTGYRITVGVIGGIIVIFTIIYALILGNL